MKVSELLLTGYPEVIGLKGLLCGDFGHLGQKEACSGSLLASESVGDRGDPNRQAL
jgi:hypothetical protein